MKRARPQAVELAGSTRDAPLGSAYGGEIGPDGPLAATLHFKRRSPAPAPGSAADLRRLLRPMTLRALERQRARTHARAAARIARFARAHGIAVRDVDLTGRRMVLEAPAGVLMAMFGATVRMYRDGPRIFRARTGVLRIPREIAPWTRAVVGFDQRPLPRPAAGEAVGGLWPTQVASLYGIPLYRNVAGQCVGIIACGGGYLPSDLAQALA